MYEGGHCVKQFKNCLKLRFIGTGKPGELLCEAEMTSEKAKRINCLQQFRLCGERCKLPGAVRGGASGAKVFCAVREYALVVKYQDNYVFAESYCTYCSAEPEPAKAVARAPRSCYTTSLPEVSRVHSCVNGNGIPSREPRTSNSN